MKHFTAEELYKLDRDHLIALVLAYQKSHQALMEINESSKQLLGEVSKGYERATTTRHRPID